MSEELTVSPEELLEELALALEQENFVELEEIAEEAIELYPQTAWSYYYMGEAQLLQFNDHAALDQFNRAVELDTENLDYLNCQALCLSKLGEEEKAQKIYEQIIQTDASYTNAHISLGVIALNKSDMDTAVNAFSQALALEDNVFALKMRALAYENTEAFDLAIADLDRALTLDANDETIRQQKVGIYFSTGNTDAIISTLESIIALDEENIDAVANLGDFLTSVEQYAKAEDVFTQAIEREFFGEFAAIPNFLKRAEARKLQEKYALAIEDYQKVIKLDGKNTAAYSGIANTLCMQMNYEPALMYLDIGLSLVIDDSSSLTLKKGEILATQQKYAEAIEVYNSLEQHTDPLVIADVQFALGKVFQAQNNLDKAYKAWTIASENFHAEADDYIEQYCQEQVKAALKEREGELLGEMQNKASQNSQSAILSQLFKQFWKVDVNSTIKANPVFTELPKAMEKQFMALLENICLAVSPLGIIVLNPGQADVRMAYGIEEETAKDVILTGIPLGGQEERRFTLSMKGKDLIMRGFGDKNADINLCMKNNDFTGLKAGTRSYIQKLQEQGDMDFMGDEFTSLLK